MMVGEKFCLMYENENKRHSYNIFCAIGYYNSNFTTIKLTEL